MKKIVIIGMIALVSMPFFSYSMNSKRKAKNLGAAAQKRNNKKRKGEEGKEIILWNGHPKGEEGKEIILWNEHPKGEEGKEIILWNGHPKGEEGKEIILWNGHPKGEEGEEIILWNTLSIEIKLMIFDFVLNTTNGILTTKKDGQSIRTMLVQWTNLRSVNQEMRFLVDDVFKMEGVADYCWQKNLNALLRILKMLSKSACLCTPFFKIPKSRVLCDKLFAYKILRHASSKKYNKLVKGLFSAGVLETASGNRTLIQAIFLHNAQRVESLLASKCDQAALPNGANPIMMAADIGDLAILKLLLISGDKDLLNVTNTANKTALMYAIKGEHKEIAELLLKYGASVYEKHDSGNTVLHYAAEWGNKEVVELLLKHKASIHEKNQCGLTALHCAAMRGNKEAVELLLSHGASIDEKDADGRGFAAFYATSGKNREILKLLIAIGLCIDKQDESGKTLLHLAVEWGNKEIAEELLCQGLDVNAKDKSGRTPLHYAVVGEAVRFRKEIIELLLKYGAPIDEQDISGATALYLAITRGKKECEKVLLDNGASMELAECLFQDWLNSVQGVQKLS